MARKYLHYPPGRFKPSDAGHIAKRLDEACAALVARGFRIGPSNRLIAARQELRAVDLSGQFPSTAQGRDKFVNAVRCAFEIVHIVDFLPAELNPALWLDIRTMLRGALAASEPNKAIRSQGQLHFATILRAAGLEPACPTQSETKSPDYIVSVDGLAFGVEVKQPQGPRGVVQALDGAARQLEQYGCRQGVVILDLTDVVSAELPKASTHRAFKAAFDSALRAALDHHDKNAGKKGYSLILVMFVFARADLWSQGSTPEYDPVFAAEGVVVRAACSGLLIESGVRLLRRLIAGMDDLGAEVTQAIVH